MRRSCSHYVSCWQKKAWKYESRQWYTACCLLYSAAFRVSRFLLMFRSIVDKLVFGMGFLTGGMFPSYIIQYQQRLGGLVDQVRRDLGPFQQIANQYHGGSLDALIRHHLASSDPTFHDEGAAIQLMADNLLQLSDAYGALDTSLIGQIIYLATHIDEPLARSTLDGFSPAFVTSVDALTSAFVMAFLFSLVFHGVVWGSGSLANLLLRRDHAKP